MLWTAACIQKARARACVWVWSRSRGGGKRKTEGRPLAVIIQWCAAPHHTTWKARQLFALCVYVFVWREDWGPRARWFLAGRSGGLLLARAPLPPPPFPPHWLLCVRAGWLAGCYLHSYGRSVAAFVRKVCRQCGGPSAMFRSPLQVQPLVASLVHSSSHYYQLISLFCIVISVSFIVYCCPQLHSLGYKTCAIKMELRDVSSHHRKRFVVLFIFKKKSLSIALTQK